MIVKGLVIVAALLATALAQLPGSAQTPGAKPPSPALSTSSSAAAPGSAASPDCLAVPCDYQPQHITVANPPVLPVQWLLRDRITWAANLVLVLLGYAGIMLAVSTLRKIERQTRYAETAADAAAASAQAALLHAQSIVNAERPWLLIVVEPSLNIENSFAAVVMNRGRTPAQIDAIANHITIAADEAHLPATPQYRDEEPGAPRVPIILLPGESASLKTFSRENVRGLCGSEEQFKRIENWEEKIFIYGRIVYKDLIAPAGQQTHETAWCCWYIHGRQKSGLVVAGPPAYSLHT
ncbi:MAG: hypothetical protein P4K94_05520 [Terracidiphilus sp.]|nr:hypothetical protein [Terracidiphilus sp.]